MTTPTAFANARIAETKAGKPQTDKLIFINNIRWLLTIFVVMIHLHVTYSGMGMWYYKDPGQMGPLSFWFFILYQCVAQAFVLGIFFFIAGYFTPGSYAKRGFGRFIRDRFIRLGIPTLVYMLVIHPATVLLAKPISQDMPPSLASWYGHYITSFAFLSNSGPMWFTLALFVFTAIYALICIFPTPTTIPNHKQPVALIHRRVFAVIVLISAATFLLRIVLPAGTPLFNHEPGNFLQIGFFAQYIIAYILGIITSEYNLLELIPYKFGKFWFKLALILGLPLLPALFISGGIASNPSAFFGGLHWQSAAYATWESFMFVGIALGLLAIFGEKNNTQGPRRRFLSENAFGVYVFHPPILVGLAILFHKMALPPLAKMYIMALIVLPISFLFSYLIKKVPSLKQLFA